MWSLWACETITASSARGSNENWRFGLFGIDPIGIEQPAIEQDALGTDLQEMGAARDLPGRAVERDSQPSTLPTNPRSEDPEPGQIGCLIAVVSTRPRTGPLRMQITPGGGAWHGNTSFA